MVQQDLPAVWEWFDYRRELVERASSQTRPIMQSRRWQDRFPDFTLVTQNIDGLHQKAGSRNVIELHGNIWRARCIACHARYEIPKGAQRPDACLSCGDRLRPDVVLFGECCRPGAFERCRRGGREL